MSRPGSVAPAGRWRFYSSLLRTAGECADAWGLGLRTLPDQQLRVEREALEAEPPGPAQQFVRRLYDDEAERRRGVR